MGLVGSCRLAWLLLGSLFLASAAIAAEGEAYVPLFIIERSVNKNVVHYDAKLRNGKLDPEQPVVAYWVMGENNGRRQELNLLERLKAYGFSVKPDKDPETFKLTIVSDKKKEIRIVGKGQEVRAEAKIGNCEAQLKRIFIASKKSFILSLPEYAEMIGNDISTGSECRERVTPADR